MAESRGPTNVYTPTSLGELLSLYDKLPQALLFNGGTHILRELRGIYDRLPANVINIARVEDLNRINRTERHIDIGSAVTVSRILDIGANVLPRSLHDALVAMLPPGVRNLATLGGNICIRDRRRTIYPVYLLLEIQLELRRLGATRWTPLSRFAGPGPRLDLQGGEVLTRIRIPFSTWDREVYRRIDQELESPSDFLSFCGLARMEKNVINDVRFAFGTAGTIVVRSRELENELIGRHLPLGRREMAPVAELLDATLSGLRDGLSGFQKDRIRSILEWFLDQLAEE